MTPQHLQKCKQGRQKQEERKPVSPVKYSQWMEKNPPCKDFSPPRSRINSPAMFAVPEEPVVGSLVASARKSALKS